MTGTKYFKYCMLQEQSIVCYKKVLHVTRTKYCMLQEQSIVCYKNKVLYVTRTKYCVMRIKYCVTRTKYCEVWKRNLYLSSVQLGFLWAPTSCQMAFRTGPLCIETETVPDQPRTPAELVKV